MQTSVVVRLAAAVGVLLLLIVVPAVTQNVDQKLADLQRQIDELREGGTGGKADFRVFWKEGLRLSTGDKKFQLKIGGRVMNDWVFFSSDRQIEGAVGKLEDGTEFRRARLYVEGTVYDVVIFKGQYDFAGGDADLKDAYVGLKSVPVLGKIKAGHFKEPFSLEELTSSKYITFMERSLPNIFAPGRNTGIGFMNSCEDDRVTFAAGVFRDTNDYGMGRDGIGAGEYAVTTRLTLLPVHEDEGKTLVHLGVAGSWRNVNNDLLRVRQRPEVHLAPRFVDTGTFPVDRVYLAGAEAAVVYNQCSVQAEYIHAAVNVDGGNNADYHSYYIFGSFFITGENRAYKKTAGVFSRVKPKQNFMDGDGIGAVEIAGRFSQLDLDETGLPPAGKKGGVLTDYTLGLNWYLNPNTRVMANYIWSHLERAGTVGMYQMRFQIDF